MQVAVASQFAARLFEICLGRQHFQAEAFAVEPRQGLALVHVIAFLGQQFDDVARDPCNDRCIGVRGDRGRSGVGGENVLAVWLCDLDGYRRRRLDRVGVRQAGFSHATPGELGRCGQGEYCNERFCCFHDPATILFGVVVKYNTR